MTEIDRFERELAEWLATEAGARLPAYTNDFLARVARTPQRPRWAIPERWLPMTPAILAATGRPLRLARLLVVLALFILLAIAAGLFIVGQRRTLPPFGPAANGLIAFDVDGQIRLAEADGRHPRAIVSAQGLATHPVFSPDGTRIAFYVNDGGKPGSGPFRVAVMNADGSGQRVLSNDAFAVAFAPGWSPDGTRLLVPVDDHGIPRVAVVRSDGSGWSWLGGPAVAATGAWWSSDGSLIAFRAPSLCVSGGGRSWDLGLYVLKADGTGAISRLPTSPGSGYAFSTSQWAPDGTHRIAYYFGPDGHHRIAVLDVDTGREVVLSHTDEEQIAPAWSPDGTRIAINAGHVLVVRADGSGDVAVVPFGPAGIAEWTVPTWSPDGTKVFAVGADEKELLVANADGSGDPVAIPVTGVTGLQGWYSWQRVAR